MANVRDLHVHPHLDTSAAAPRSVTGEWSIIDDDEVALTFTVTGAANVILPAPADPARTDGLWRTTCFELFWKPGGGDAYVEINISPSGRWAAYAFDGYRVGMRDHPMAVAPHIEVARDRDVLTVRVDMNLSTLPPGPADVGISAVIEDTDGAKSYWALVHPPGPPDFHHHDCFAMRVPAVGSP